MVEPTGGQKTLGVVTQVGGTVSLVVGNTRCFALPDEVEGKPEVGSVVTIENLEAGGGGRAFGLKVVGHISDLAKPVIEVIADHPFLRYVPNTCVVGLDQEPHKGNQCGLTETVAEAIGRGGSAGLGSDPSNYRVVVVIPSGRTS